MSMQRVQGVLLFLVRFNNFAQFEIHGVTRSYSSRPFLCALVQTYRVCVDDTLIVEQSLLKMGVYTNQSAYIPCRPGGP